MIEQRGLRRMKQQKSGDCAEDDWAEGVYGGWSSRNVACNGGKWYTRGDRWQVVHSCAIDSAVHCMTMIPSDSKKTHQHHHNHQNVYQSPHWHWRDQRASVKRETDREGREKEWEKEEARTKRDSNSLGIVIVVAIGNVIMLVVTRKRIICELYIVHSA